MNDLWNRKSSILPASIARKVQPQDDIIVRTPLWIWIVGGLVIVAITVIWTLYEERKKERVSTLPPEPVGARGGAAFAVPAEDATMLIPQTAITPPAKAVKTSPPAGSDLPTPAERDNLKRIVGIGPKIMQILNDHGIFTFEQLAQTEVTFLNELVEARGWHMADPTSWPEQARSLAEQKRKEL
jgi:predicted flap endonuclease-1-like 5' DNA nuclease